MNKNMLMNLWLERSVLRKLLDHDNLLTAKRTASDHIACDQTAAQMQFQNLYIAILQLSKKWKSSNQLWLVTTENVSKVFLTACQFTYTFRNNIDYIGTINDKWRLCVDPNWGDEIMVGVDWNLDGTPKHVGIIELHR